jgi:hypothetical protein
MAKYNNFITLTLVILLGCLIQAGLYFAENRDTPTRAVLEFSKAYFQLDPSMSERLCEERRTLDDVDVVAEYLQAVAKEAGQRGFRLSYIKNKLYNIGIFVINEDDDQAEIRLVGDRKPSLRSLFTGETYQVDETIKVIKEDGKWKVCGDNLFSLP